jgi:hypothetical protein
LGDDLLDVPLLLVPEAIFLPFVVLVIVVILVGVVILLPLREVRVLRVYSPLLSKLMHFPKFPYKQCNLIIGNALVLLIESYSKRIQNKLQRR